jgi:hypothetical protein
MKVKNIPRHTVKHIWQAYAKHLLKNNPHYWGAPRKGVMPNFYVFEKRNGKIVEVMTYESFRKIVERIFNRAKHHIIQGESFRIPGCGLICAKRIERDFRTKKKSVDWKKTVASGHTIVNGKKKYNRTYYRTESDYCRIGWFRPRRVRFIDVYEFEPTARSSGDSETAVGGFKSEFSLALSANPLLKYMYLYNPITELLEVEE